MCGKPGVSPPASLLSGGRPSAPRAWVYSLVLLLLFSAPAIALSESLPPPGSVVPSEPVSRAKQDLSRAFEEAMQAGVDALQSGNTTAAVAAFERAVALQPRQAIAQALLGSALLAAERAEEALGPLGRAVELDPQLFIAQQNLGLARLQTSRPGGGRRSARGCTRS